MELPSSELEFNCFYRNWNWSGIAFIGIEIGIELPLGLGTGFAIGVELPLSELELELNCKNGINPSSVVSQKVQRIVRCNGFMKPALVSFVQRFSALVFTPFPA